jgi:hypothetical protein
MSKKSEAKLGDLDADVGVVLALWAMQVSDTNNSNSSFFA